MGLIPHSLFRGDRFSRLSFPMLRAGLGDPLHELAESVPSVRDQLNIFQLWGLPFHALSLAWRGWIRTGPAAHYPSGCHCPAALAAAIAPQAPL